MLPWFSYLARQLSARRQQHTLHHGLLLSGNMGIGKHQFAQDLAQILLCAKPESATRESERLACGTCQSCLLFKADTHPDYYQIESEKQIGVDAIRQAIEKLNTTAQLGGNKVLIIHQADSMTESASNALLKTLEEPTANTFMLLVSAHKHRLLATVRSRCENVLLPSPNEQETLVWLQQQGLAKVELGDIRAFGNAPFILKEVFSEGSKALTFSVFNEQIKALQNGQTDALELAKQWQDDSNRVTEWCANYWMNAVKQGWLNKSQSTLQTASHEASSAQSPTQGNAFECYQHCLTVKQHLHHAGVNKVVLLTGLLQLFSHA